AEVAPAAVRVGLSNGVALLNPDVYDQLRFWQAGSVDIRTLQTLKIVLLPVVVAGIAALLLGGALNSLSPVSYTHLLTDRNYATCWPFWQAGR
ncbi:hypothetical protein AAER91_30170, partial [Klebsiella pneumoniae]